jgi:hypothetical protein
VDEDGRRRFAADRDAGRVVAERTRVAMRVELAVGADPAHGPAEAGDAEPLQALGEQPQLLEPERLRGPGDELLAHRGDDRRREPAPDGVGFFPSISGCRMSARMAVDRPGTSWLITAPMNEDRQAAP